jgi:purine nucleoside phosphorylase
MALTVALRVAHLRCPVVAIGIITGSGTHALPGLEHAEARVVETQFGAVPVTEGIWAGVEVVHLSRHGEGHERLSHQVRFQANALALAAAGATAIVGCTVCGGVDPGLAPGSLVVFDDLHFPANRLPTGEVCTVFTEPGDPRRGHWVLGEPFSAGVRAGLLAGAAEAGFDARDGGCYGHVDGPRFNTVAEIAQLAAAGVAAVSQTGGPETVLFGELEIPYGLLGFVTDHANGASPGEPTSVEELVGLLKASTGAYAAILERTLPRLAAEPPAPAGTTLGLGS